MKKTFLIMLFLSAFLLTGCETMNAFFGIDDQGNKTEGASPSSYLLAILKGLGPWGVLTATALTAGGTAYAGSKKKEAPLKSIINAVEIAKETMTPEASQVFIKKLKLHIPNKYHPMIDRYRGKI